MQDSGLNKGSAGTRHRGWFGCKSMEQVNTSLGTQFFDFIFFRAIFAILNFNSRFVKVYVFVVSFFFRFSKSVMYWSSIWSLRSRRSPIDLFTSQASTWRGGTVKPVEPNFFGKSRGCLCSFYCCSFTLLSIMYSTSFRLQNNRFLACRVQIANSVFQNVRYSNYHLLHILLFLLLLMLLLVFQSLPPLNFNSQPTGHHRRESGLPLLCPLSPVSVTAVGWMRDR